ncbi:glycosyltransferase [Geminocystis sp. NIES-3709]|uniref:glycosyltransferase n=1 Tax=Geminocystis sp. NIES-3709 TaxID=1617448 RepID=UPI0005FCC9AF|nr:glycosyltransferase [Geminocystis sp. NIES-3709]BAQ63260.1 hypothetical protein GM3709_25 [Geminocystis sp. NIES-3709]
MKILHVIPSVSFVRGGPSKAVLEMVKALQDNEIEVEIVTTNDHGDNLLDVPLKQKVIYKKVPVIFFHRFSPNINFIREFAFSLDLTIWLFENINKYDLIHVHAIFSYTSTIAMIIARLKKIPYIVRPLGQLCSWSLTQKAKKKQIYFDLVEKTNLEGSNFVHCTAFQEQQEVKNLGLKINSFVIPLGINSTNLILFAQKKLRQKFNISDNTSIILFLSRIHEKKGLEFLISALAKIDYDYRFIIAGVGDIEYEKKIKLLIEKENINDKTYWVGFVEGEFKNLLLQGSDLFALTSYSENFGIAVLEALEAGLSVIITPEVALSEVIKENNLGYVTDLDIDKIAITIEKALKNQDSLRLIDDREITLSRDRARKFILENYTWDHIAKQLIEVYQQIINTDL